MNINYESTSAERMCDELLKEFTINKQEQALAARICAVQLHQKAKTKSKKTENTLKTDNWVFAGRKDELR